MLNNQILSLTMQYSFISTIYYEQNIFVYNYLYLLVNPIINRMVEPMQSSFDPFIGEDFMIDICQNKTQIFWQTLDYDRITQTMNALANNFGDKQYYWDLRDTNNQLLAECRSETFELDGEISVRPNNNNHLQSKAEAMIYEISKILNKSDI